MSNLCKCGCGQTVNKNYAKGHWGKINRINYNKGKTYEELYGVEKANSLKKLISELHKGTVKPYVREQMIRNRKGKTYEDMYGVERAKLMKDKIIKNRKCGYGSFKVMFGEERAKEIGNKISFKITGKKKLHYIKTQKAFDHYAKKTIPKEKILKGLQNAFEENGPFKKSDFDKYITICSSGAARHKFGSLDDLAREANIVWAKPKFWNDRTNKGRNEDLILDTIESRNNIVIERQVPINKYHLDGYDRDNNVVYEVDEYHHRFSKVQDYLREKEIKSILGCIFIRVNEKEFLQGIVNQSLENFTEGVKNE
jgi:very-short-patch-repair endonuclease